MLPELVCVAGVVAELEDEGSLASLDDIVRWIELISVVNATTDDVCDELGCELRLLDSAGLAENLADENTEELANKVLVGGNKKADWEKGLLNLAEVCEMVAGEVADELGDKTAVDDNIVCNVEVGEALAVVDMVIEKTAVLVKDVVDVLVEEAIEFIVEVAEKIIVKSGAEVAADCTGEIVDGVAGTEEVPIAVESATIDKGTVVEVDVGTALVEAAAPNDMARIVETAVNVEDGVGTALEERLLALIMSAACARRLGRYCTKGKCKQAFIPSLLLRTRRPANGQLGSLGRSLHRPPSSSAYLNVSRSQRGFFEARNGGM